MHAATIYILIDYGEWAKLMYRTSQSLGSKIHKTGLWTNQEDVMIMYVIFPLEHRWGDHVLSPTLCGCVRVCPNCFHKNKWVLQKRQKRGLLEVTLLVHLLYYSIRIAIGLMTPLSSTYIWHRWRPTSTLNLKVILAVSSSCLNRLIFSTLPSACYEKLRMILKTHERIRVQYDGKFHLGDPCLW